MTEYEVRFIGPPIAVGGRSLGAVREAITVEASGRADAYVQAYRHLSRPGQPVTVTSAGDGENPLGLSDEEVQEVLSAEVPLEQGLSPHGYRIESLSEAPAWRWKPVLVGMLATPVLLAVAIVSAGGGHGTAAPMLLLFPFTMLVGPGSGGHGLPLLVAAIQYPVYGAVWSLAGANPALRPLRWAMWLLHALAVLVATGAFPA
jgi:hypothetical protein